MSRRSVAYKKGYEHTDFTVLLGELNGKETTIAENASEGMPDKEELKTSEEKSLPVESEERHRIMSDPKIKYLWSKKQKIIHDKHCCHAKAIPDDELEWSEAYRVGLGICQECMVQAYVVAGAKDPKEIDRYLQFFEKAGMTESQIRNIYIENGMKTRIAMDFLTIWHKEDAWRIKTLPKKGHVQLYHNNYVVRKKGVREFTQGFHLQSAFCEDTNISYALSIIKNYSYKPEERALHTPRDAAGMKKLRKEQTQQREQNALSMEALLGDSTIRLTLWHKVKRYVQGLFTKKSFFAMNDFSLVADTGYPKDQTICIYIWKDKNGQYLWQTGMYHQKIGHFSVRYGVNVYAVKQTKVVAWKKMTPEAMALEIYNEEGDGTDD